MRHFIKESNLIIDLGMNNGNDTAYYLARGYRVVGIEANPALCMAAHQRFADAIAASQLEIMNMAISDISALQTFYINHTVDHWSSLDVAWAGREGHLLEPIMVEGLTITQLFAKFGTPFYLKIDIEGADELVLDQLDLLNDLPQYLSVEDCRFGFRYIEKMAALGYSEFQLLDQSEVAKLMDPFIEWRFVTGASGPFGEALPGEWLKTEEMIEHYSRTVRDRSGYRHTSHDHWWDIHARGPIEVM